MKDSYNLTTVKFGESSKFIPKRTNFAVPRLILPELQFCFPIWKLVVVTYSDQRDTQGHLEHPETVIFGVLFEPSICPDIQGA